MEELVGQVKKLFTYATPQEKHFLRGVPRKDNIKKEIENFHKVSESSRVPARRVAVGDIIMDNERVVGYHEFTIMDKANATPYERENLNMGNGLNDFYSRRLFVHPDSRGKNLGQKMMKRALSLAHDVGKHYIVNAERDNYHLVNVLSDCGFEPDFTWNTPKGVEMTRFYHD